MDTGRPTRMDTGRLARLAEEPVDHRFKGLPPDAEGLLTGQLAAQQRNLYTGGFTTPVLTLSAEDLEHNLRLMEGYAARHGLSFAPHGKTTMAPQLFQRQFAHGAWGITLAVPHQVRVAREFGAPVVLLANEVVDRAALHWLSAELDRDPGFRLLCYVDSVRGVALMDEALRGRNRPLEVMVELAAGDEARTGVRGEAEALTVARAVAATGTLRLAGVAGYEADLPGAGPATVRAWLDRLLGLAQLLDGEGLFAGAEEIVVSAGGSSWFDAVAAAFARLPALSRPVRKVLRSGAYVTHDDGRYQESTPFNRIPEEGALRPALRLWAQVVSRPSPEQAFLNAGKRDVSYDMGLPVPLLVRSARDGAERAAEGIEVSRLSDQHAWLRTAPSSEIEVGDWVALGLSHPCTVFEKWPMIPVVRRGGAVVEYIRTFF
ncbi:amino acid aldolase [Streptomyces albus]|uniref:Amino acid aldolase n=1 Tax=Streptomyces albus (strain ATCC 21838 / DSM 41398 / FERM P-419 / JCM 4703 / NBRC 107858) TaxID=1081613 RepID=A0A0B5F1C6_STRA4|nr:amino acid aldolase [Streptomyces albus]AOU79652.1 amino acid aldolase [Streptomyces albus]AYN35373.1 amino acid aldolase [Streptomyces albus]